jgi:hypothetical protein
MLIVKINPIILLFVFVLSQKAVVSDDRLLSQMTQFGGKFKAALSNDIIFFRHTCKMQFFMTNFYLFLNQLCSHMKILLEKPSVSNDQFFRHIKTVCHQLWQMATRLDNVG